MLIQEASKVITGKLLTLRALWLFIVQLRVSTSIDVDDTTALRCVPRVLGETLGVVQKQ